MALNTYEMLFTRVAICDVGLFVVLAGDLDHRWCGNRGKTNIAGKQRVGTESTTLALIVGKKDDENVFDGHNKSDGPYDN